MISKNRTGSPADAGFSFALIQDAERAPLSDALTT